MVNIRTMTLDDIEQVYGIEESIFSIPWSKTSFENSINSKDTLFVVAEKENKIIGYLGIYFFFEDADISNVAVEKEYRRQHIGRALLEYILVEAKSRGVKNITLEVRESNEEAIKFYLKNNFKEITKRKNYYKDEDGILMIKNLGE